MVGGFALDLLGRHIARCAQHFSSPGHHRRLALERLCQPEVGDVRVAGAIEEDVLRLETPVNSAYPMRRFQCRQELPRDVHYFWGREASLPLEAMLQVLAL